MSIYKSLEKKAEKHEGISEELLVLAKKVTAEAKEHLKLIHSQLPEFDSHDGSHSEKVLENMEKLLGDKITVLSGCELFLLYLAAYCHDCAMALPIWEFRLLALCEGTEELDIPEYRNCLKCDLHKPFNRSQAKKIVEERKDYLFHGVSKYDEFIFAEKLEDRFNKDLCERLIEYQEFRNGYKRELQGFIEEEKAEEYVKFSAGIRREFIRSTHGIRVEKYLKNLAPLFTERLGGSWGDYLANALARVCRAHGENFSFIVDNMWTDINRSIYGTDTVNLPFIAVMLRLGDVIHFSYDRASRSLFAEKSIESAISIEHWRAKFQGLNYTIENTYDNGKNIKFMAMCKEPGSYYFINDYINNIDDEIVNYFRLISHLKDKVSTQNLAVKYDIGIAEKVDRSNIAWDEDKFTPKPGLKFTLNQKKIMELLMGKELYKDEYLCLRELYQNSLDACRCAISMYSSHNIDFRGEIEFGLGEEVVEENTEKYIYCLDNGVGMTEEIIEKYFINIGTSYYSSDEFSSRIL